MRVGREHRQGDAFRQEGVGEPVGAERTSDDQPLQHAGENWARGDSVCGRVTGMELATGRFMLSTVENGQLGGQVVHVVIMGCGRVGSSLAAAARAPRPHGRGDRQGRRRRSAGSASTSTASRSSAAASTGKVLIEAGHRAGRRVRGGVQRRQLQHHLRAGGPRDVRRRARGRPDLRRQARRGLRAARHPHGRHRAVDDRPADADAAARRRRRRRGATRPARSRCSSCRCTRAGSATRSRELEAATGARVAFIMRFGTGVLPTPKTVVQADDQVYVRGAVRHDQRRHQRRGPAP